MELALHQLEVKDKQAVRLHKAQLEKEKLAVEKKIVIILYKEKLAMSLEEKKPALEMQKMAWKQQKAGSGTAALKEKEAAGVRCTYGGFRKDLVPNFVVGNNIDKWLLA
ncbi:hypothetical protein NDU88_004380 [Pleurodeles waltl]|uniref:Uncharacterized protein n=1 Tax=Pleurodeles waltl TaxID=8319 RepID=A0AAV7SIL0_PLEWA|nr:hypothetical protein NDU88_004380 [Pleurodeles waltl]